MDWARLREEINLNIQFQIEDDDEHFGAPMWRPLKPGVKKLTSLSGDVLLNQHFSLENCLDILRLASACRLRELVARVAKYIAENFTALSQRPQFLDLPSEAICEVLSENSISLSDEREVLAVALQWLHQNEQRLEHAGKILRSVRLATISFSEDEVKQLKAKEAAFKTAEGRQLMDEATKYRKSPADRWSMCNRSTRPRCKSGKRRVLAAVSVSDTHVWVDEQQAWTSIKNTLVMESKSTAERESPQDCSLDVVCYGEDLYFAVWEWNTLFRCSDFPSGIWQEICSLPAKTVPMSLIATPGYLYVLGHSSKGSTLVHRMNLSTGQWEKAPTLPVWVNFSCWFYVDNMIYLLEENIVSDDEQFPDVVHGLHILDLKRQAWMSFDFPMKNWEHFIVDVQLISLSPQQPVYRKGKVYLCGEDEFITFDVATRKFTNSMPLDVFYSTMDSAVCFDDRVTWISDDGVCGRDLDEKDEVEWPGLPLSEDTQLVVVDVNESQWEKEMSRASQEGRVTSRQENSAEIVARLKNVTVN